MNKQKNKKTIIEFKNFSFYYNKNDKKPILTQINWKIPYNHVTSIIGRSGSGKSTLLWSINRMHELRADSMIKGDILFNNLSIYDKSVNPIELRQKIGIVFQKPTPFKMSIFENVAFSLRMKGLHDPKKLQKIVETSLKSVLLWDEVKDRLHSKATELSGGQQQRLCIARCIANKPSVILFDEPTSSLDPIAREKIENLIFALKKEYTIILITHSLKEATKVSDYTLFVDKGQIIEFGKTTHLFTEPKNKLTMEYINNRLDN